MNSVIGSADLKKLLKSYISPVTRVALGINISLQYNRLIINQSDTYLYEVLLPINTGFSLGLGEDVIKLILTTKEGDITAYGFHPQMFHNQYISDTLVRKMEFYSNITKSLRRTVYIDDLSTHEDFQMKTKDLKASDGCKFVHFQGEDLYDRYLIPVFAGFPNLTKMDNMGIAIYRCNNCNYIAEYFIRKKKIKAEYHCFSRHSDMDRHLRWVENLG